MYHAVVDAPLDVPDWCFMAKSDFDAQMEYISRFGNVVPLDTALRSPGRLSPPAIAVTFDDGFKNNFDVALPILARFEIPATVFLPTAFVDSHKALWFCRVNRAIAATGLLTCRWHEETYELSSPAARAEASARMQSRLKEYSHPVLLDELDRLCALLGEAGDAPLDETSPYATLSTQTIRAMLATGLIDFGAHSETHAILSLLGSEAKALEIRRSIEKVGALRGQRCSLFAYPNGRRRDFDADCMALLRDQGIEAAVTAVEGVNDDQTPLMELRRIGIGAHTALAEFRSTLQACGFN